MLYSLGSDFTRKYEDGEERSTSVFSRPCDSLLTDLGRGIPVPALVYKQSCHQTIDPTVYRSTHIDSTDSLENRKARCSPLLKQKQAQGTRGFSRPCLVHRHAIIRAPPSAATRTRRPCKTLLSAEFCWAAQDRALTTQS